MSVTTLAKEAAKTQLSCLENCIKTLKQKIQQVEQHPDIDQQESLWANIANMEHELKHLHKKQYKNVYTKAQA